MTEAASSDAQSDNVCDVGESDFMKAAHNIIDRHIKSLEEPLALILKVTLSVVRCHQAMGVLPGARAILIRCLAVGARGILVDQKLTDEPLAAVNPCWLC